MKTSKFFLGYIKSFYSKKYYHTAAKHWFGRSFLFVFLFLVVFWAIYTGIFAHRAYGTVKTYGDVISQQMPELYFKDGTALTVSKQPAFVFLPGVKDPMMVVDTYGQFKDFEKTSSLFFLVSGKSFFIKQPSKKTIREISYPTDLHGALTKSHMKELIRDVALKFLPVLVIVLYIGGLIIGYLGYLIVSLILALFGLLISKWMSRSLTYRQLFSLSLIIQVPACLLTVLIAHLGVTMKLMLPVHVLLAFLYLWLAIRANEKKKADI